MTDKQEIVLSGPLEKSRGAIGRYPAPDERYVFPFTRVRYRLVHMLGVRRPLRVQWIVDGDCRADRVLEPWTGRGYHLADRIIEQQP